MIFTAIFDHSIPSAQLWQATQSGSSPWTADSLPSIASAGPSKRPNSPAATDFEADFTAKGGGGQQRVNPHNPPRQTAFPKNAS
jgi:hypothetical protein